MKPSPKELSEVIEKHRKWLSNEGGGERADLQRANLWDANLQGADLQNANLQGADLQGADLRGADLQGADLRGAKLQGADLRGANLLGAKLQGADLQGADLQGADLQGATLRGADLQGATLRGADLLGADLDFSSGFSFKCTSFDVKIDLRIVAQLAYHFCRMVCDDPAFIAARDALAPLANQFHRVAECGTIELIAGAERG